MYVELGEGHKEEEGVCVRARVCVCAVGGGGGEECLVCAGDINSKKRGGFHTNCQWIKIRLKLKLLLYNNFQFYYKRVLVPLVTE